MTSLNTLPAVAAARQPRGMVLLGDPNQPGTSVPWIDWDVEQNTWHPASTFRMRLPDGLPIAVEERSKSLRDAYPDLNERARAVLRTSKAFLDRVQR